MLREHPGWEAAPLQLEYVDGLSIRYARKGANLLELDINIQTISRLETNVGNVLKLLDSGGPRKASRVMYQALQGLYCTILHADL